MVQSKRTEPACLRDDALDSDHLAREEGVASELVHNETGALRVIAGFGGPHTLNPDVVRRQLVGTALAAHATHHGDGLLRQGERVVAGRLGHAVSGQDGLAQLFGASAQRLGLRHGDLTPGP